MQLNWKICISLLIIISFFFFIYSLILILTCVNIAYFKVVWGGISITLWPFVFFFSVSFHWPKRAHCHTLKNDYNIRGYHLVGRGRWGEILNVVRQAALYSYYKCLHFLAHLGSYLQGGVEHEKTSRLKNLFSKNLKITWIISSLKIDWLIDWCFRMQT